VVPVESSPSAKVNGDMAAAFKALSDGTRLGVLRMLTSGELCACELLEGFHISQPTLSYHMNMLCGAGLVNARRDGAWVHYSLNRERLRAVRAQLDEIIDDNGSNGDDHKWCCSGGSMTSC
jgi:ArsR family transcriptional regulator